MISEGPELASEVVLVLVTLRDEDEGRTLARSLVTEGLAACGNVIPGLTSVYRWEGKVHEDGEALLLLKTTRRTLPDLTSRVEELHSYDLPEILAIPVVDGSAPYLRWVLGEVDSMGKAR